MGFDEEMSRKNRRTFFQKLGLREYTIRLLTERGQKVVVVYADSPQSAVEFAKDAHEAVAVEVTD